MLLPSVCYNSDFSEFGIGQTLGSAERKSDQCRVQCDASHHFNWAITAKPRPSVKRKLCCCFFVFVRNLGGGGGCLGLVIIPSGF